jgi:hypothetical protein
MKRSKVWGHGLLIHLVRQDAPTFGLSFGCQHLSQVIPTYAVETNPPGRWRSSIHALLKGVGVSTYPRSLLSSLNMRDEGVK